MSLKPKISSPIILRIARSLGNTCAKFMSVTLRSSVKKLHFLFVGRSWNVSNSFHCPRCCFNWAEKGVRSPEHLYCVVSLIVLLEFESDDN